MTALVSSSSLKRCRFLGREFIVTVVAKRSSFFFVYFIKYFDYVALFIFRLTPLVFSTCPCSAPRKEENGVLRILCVPFAHTSHTEEIGGLGIPLRSLWPTLHCRRVAGVSPLLSIGWWYLSFVSPKRHCYRVSAADKGCRVDPLDPRPDAVALYSGCTPGKRRAWFLPDDRHTASCWTPWWEEDEFVLRTYGSNAAVPG
ncbi:uncharacterized protein TNCV_2710661 [Trichonephila clavipes]|nr:uncharacterized protein TNCV_2710661 [Trichonephila clavipes]